MRNKPYLKGWQCAVCGNFDILPADVLWDGAEGAGDDRSEVMHAVATSCGLDRHPIRSATFENTGRLDTAT